MAQRLLENRIVPRNQRTPLQLPQKRREPETGKPQDRQRIHPVRMEGRAMAFSTMLPERRSDDPVVIENAHEENQQGHNTKRLRIVLDPAHQQQSEWQEEVEEDQQQRNHTPAAVSTWDVVRHLFPDVAVPDEEELRERRVRPQHHEREEKIAEVSIRNGTEDLGERLIFG